MGMRAVILVGFAGLAGGCSFFTPPMERPIIEDHALGNVNAFSLIPSRRMVIVKRDSQGDPSTAPIAVCAEPAPDVTDNLASTFASSLAASVPGSTGAGKAVELGIALERTLQTFAQVLFKRTQGLQLYRDRMSQLCIARMNGYLTNETYIRNANEAYASVIPLIEKELPQLQPIAAKDLKQKEDLLKQQGTSATAGGAKASTGRAGAAAKVDTEEGSPQDIDPSDK